MNLKMLLWPVGVFLSGVAVAFTAALFLTVNLEDVLYHQRQIHAGQLNEPWPGKAYAYYKPTRQFVQRPLCSKELTGVSVSRYPIKVEAHNKLGLQFSEAVGFVMGTVGLKSEGYMVEDVSLSLPMEKQFMSEGQAPYLEHCVEDVVAKASDPDYIVLMVENAYFVENEATGLPEGKMVAFNPKPITFSFCDPSAPNATCDFEELSVDYFDARWVTRVKYLMNLISIS